MQQFETLKKSTHDFSGKTITSVAKAGRTEGYDAHCLRAYAYFGEQMPDIDPNSVDSINSIAKKYKKERQEGKTPTFALTL